MASRLLPRVAGQWFTPHESTSASVNAAEARLLITPFDLAAPMKIDRTTFELAVVGGAGEVMRVGYYQDDGSNNRPGLLVADIGTVAIDAGVGLKNIDAPVTLPAGRVYVVHAAQGASGVTPNLRVAISYSARILTPTLGGVFQNTVCVEGITGALPATLVGATFVTINFGPAVGMRLAA